MKRRLFTIVAYTALAVVYLLFKDNVGPWFNLLLKALPLALLFVMLCLSHNGAADKKSIVLPLLALGMSMLGDGAGELPIIHGQTKMMYMIAFFAVAHILYIISFIRFYDKDSNNRIGYLVWLFGMAVFFNIRYYLPDGTLKTAVISYLVLITLMACMSAFQKRKMLVVYVFGAVMFMISDSALAFCRYVVSFPGRDILVMGSYFLAQLMLNLPLISEKDEIQ